MLKINNLSSYEKTKKKKPDLNFPRIGGKVQIFPKISARFAGNGYILK